MKEERFIEKNLPVWQSIEAYNQKLKNSGLASLPTADIREYTSLYRLLGIHKAYAQTHYPQSQTTYYLNQLMGISHNHIYVREQSAASDVWGYFSRSFPAQVRAYKRYILLALGVFLAGAVFCAIMTTLDEAYLHLFLPKEQLQNIDFTTTARDVDYPVISAQIMTNNIKVSFLSLVWGFLGGLGTLYVLFQNGALLGALTNYVIMSGANAANYWALILPHGFIELAAIFISGGAGLIIGKSILIPGQRTRRESLVLGGREAAALVPGVVVMLIIAGLIEGFFTPLNLSAFVKLLFAGGTFLALLLYFGLLGHMAPKPQNGSLKPDND